MDTLFQDLRYAARRLARTPGFTGVAVLTLALGIGANTTIFSIVSALLLRPVPVEAPERLVRLHAGLHNPEDGSIRYSSWSYPDFAAYAARDDVFTGVAAHERRRFLLGEDEIVRAPGMAVTGGYFTTLGVRPLRGRTLLPSDDLLSAPEHVAVVSRAAWERRFGSDPEIVGKKITLEGRPFTVVGVVGSEAVFRPFGEPEVWIPMSTRAAINPTSNPLDTRRVSFISHVFARLRPGVSLEQASAVVELVGRQLADAHPETNASRFAVITPARTLRGLAMGVDQSRTMRVAAMLLMGVVGIVLLIACANVANLLLARAAARRRELGIRYALGAGRGRVIRQVLTESVVLGLLGAAGGLMLAVWGLELARRVPEVAELSPTLDVRVLAFTLVVGVATGILFGLAPVLGTGGSGPTESLREGSRGTPRRARMQRALLVGQVTLSLLLLVASGLVLRTLKNLEDVDPGFDPDRLLVAPVTLSAPGAPPFESPPAARVQALLDEVRGLPGVTGVSLSTVAPLSGINMTYQVEVPGYHPTPGEDVSATVATVEDDYFRIVGASLRRGRGFGELAPGRTDGVLVNEAMARRYWAGRDPLGERIVAAGDTLEVTGIVGDMRYAGLGEEPAPMLFFRYPRMAYSSFTLHVRTDGDPAGLAGPVRHTLQRAAPGQPVPEVRPMKEMVAESLAASRVVAGFFTLFGALALVLAAVGLYGVMAYTVAQRTREIGIRMALGADAWRVMHHVLREGGILVAVGVLLGAAAALATTRLITGVLYQVEPTDPLTFFASAVVLSAVALFASYLPARRAARVDPIIALRHE